MCVMLKLMQCLVLKWRWSFSHIIASERFSHNLVFREGFAAAPTFFIFTACCDVTMQYGADDGEVIQLTPMEEITNMMTNLGSVFELQLSCEGRNTIELVSGFRFEGRWSHDSGLGIIAVLLNCNRVISSWVATRRCRGGGGRAPIWAVIIFGICAKYSRLGGSN